MIQHSTNMDAVQFQCVVDHVIWEITINDRPMKSALRRMNASR